MSARKWLSQNRPFFWIHGEARWGWLGNGWNALELGKVRIYFASGPHPFPRVHRLLGKIASKRAA